MSVDEVARLQVAVGKFVNDLKVGNGSFQPGLRVKRVTGHPGVWEMTWAPDGRATFEFADPVLDGEVHVIWRRCGGHEIFNDP